MSKLWRRKAILEDDRRESSAAALVVSTGSAGSNKKSIVPNYSKKGGGGCHKGNDKVLPDNFGKIVRAEQKKMIPIKKAASMTGVSVYLYKKFRDQYIESH